MPIKRKSHVRHKNPKQKGNNHENATCKRLSLWASDLKRSDVFARSAASGAKATNAQRSGSTLRFTNQAGDIVSVDEIGMPLTELFVVECKSRSDLSFDRWIYKGTGTSPIIQVWEKLRNEAHKAQRMPLLIAKFTRMGELFVLDSDGNGIIEDNEIDLTPVVTVPNKDMFVYHMVDVLNQVPFQVIRDWHAAD